MPGYESNSRWHVIGHREDGHSAPLRSFAGRKEAEEAARSWAEHLEGWTRLCVQSTEGHIALEIPIMPRPENIERLRERHQARQNGEPEPPAPAPATPRGKPPGPLRNILRDLGPEATREQFLDACHAEGLEATAGNFYRLREKLGYTSGTRCRIAPAPAAETPLPAPSESPAPAASAAAAPPGDVAALLEDFLAAVKTVGGPVAARRILDVLEAK
jgi:hypothetical protein